MDDDDGDFFASQTGDLKELLGTLNEKKDANNVKSLRVNVEREFHDGESLLWQVLSHSHCKIYNLTIAEEEFDALGTSGVLKQVRRWCEEVPARWGRQLNIIFNHQDYTGENNSAFDELRAALRHPNNRIESLWLKQVPPTQEICNQVVRPALEHLNNQVTKLTLEFLYDFTVADAEALGNGLRSQNCKVETIYLGDIYVTLDHVRPILSGLAASPCLRKLQWAIDIGRLPNASQAMVVTELAGLFERPRNKVRSLTLSSTISGGFQPNQDHISILAKALANEHCHVEDINFKFGEKHNLDLMPIFDIVNRPTNKLKTLSLDGLKDEEAAAVGNGLCSANCQLELLMVRVSCGPRVAEAIAGALSMHKNHLRKLLIGRQPSPVFGAFARSLRSVNNSLTVLCIDEDGESIMDAVTCGEFLRALRISNVVSFWGRMESRFSSVFSDPFLQVLHALLSIKHVPRLGRSAPLRLLPVQDFIFRIAYALDWPLNLLRSTSK